MDWIIEPGKLVGGVDFSAEATLFDGSNLTTRSYAGGPWVVPAELVDSDVLDIVDDWQLLYSDTNVHIATADFTAPRERTLAVAPNITVFVDGHEDIAFDYLNAAGIPDSTGQAWPNAELGDYSAYPDVLTAAQVAGTLGDTSDGALFNADGLPIYAEIDVMHYDPSSFPAGLADELRSYLETGLNHVFLECKSIATMEDEPTASFLTSSGINNGGNPGGSHEFANMDLAIAQHQGTFTADSGSIRSIKLESGSFYDANVLTLIKKSGDADGVHDLLVHGPLDGDPDNGVVTLMAGHNYSSSTPISGNGQANSVRFYLNGLFISDLLQGENVPVWTLDKTGAAVSLVDTVTYSIDWSTSGPGISLGVEIVDELPAGADFVSASAGGVYDPVGHEVTWDLGDLGTGESGTETVTLQFLSEDTLRQRGQRHLLRGSHGEGDAGDVGHDAVRDRRRRRRLRSVHRLRRHRLHHQPRRRRGVRRHRQQLRRQHRRRVRHRQRHVHHLRGRLRRHGRHHQPRRGRDLRRRR